MQTSLCRSPKAFGDRGRVTLLLFFCLKYSTWNVFLTLSASLVWTDRSSEKGLRKLILSQENQLKSLNKIEKERLKIRKGTTQKKGGSGWAQNTGEGKSSLGLDEEKPLPLTQKSLLSCHSFNTYLLDLLLYAEHYSWCWAFNSELSKMLLPWNWFPQGRDIEVGGEKQ